MKKIILSAGLLALFSCSGDNKSTTTSTTSENTEATTDNTPSDAKWDDTSKWKTEDLNSFKIPLKISVPATATANQSMNDPAGVQVQFSDQYFFYEIGADPAASAKEAIENYKTSTSGDYKDFKIEKQDENGYTFTYNTTEGKTARSFYFVKDAGGKLYSVAMSGSDFEGTAEQIDKLYNGLKQ